MKRSHLVWLSIILLYAAAIRVALIDQPFSRNPEGTGAYYGQLARNYLRLPWTTTRGVPVQSVHAQPGDPVTHYANHPPLIPMLVAGSFAVFGDGAWQMRLPTVLFALSTIVLIFLMLSARGHATGGLIAAALFAAMPMTILYGGHPDCINPTLVFFILLTLLAYQRFETAPTAKNALWMMLAFLPAGWTDWPAYYLVPVVCVHFALTRPPRKWAPMIPFGLFSIGLFILVYGHIAMTIDDWRWMGRQLERRTISSDSDRSVAITWPVWLAGIAAHNLRRHTLPVLILGAIWIIGWAWRIRSHDRAATLTRLLFAFAILHVFVGRQAVLVHDWWWWPLTPALAMAGGLVGEWALHQITNRRIDDRVGQATLVGLLVAFAAWTTWKTFPIFFDPALSRGGVSFSTIEIGDAIRQAAPNPASAVFVAYNDAYDLPLWYYGDRPLKLGVWDQWTLAERQADGQADLPFGYTQSWPRAGVGYVMPREFVGANTREFVKFLQMRYPVLETEKFLIFDLTRTVATEQ